MESRYKKKALKGLGIGLTLILGGITLSLSMRGPTQTNYFLAGFLTTVRGFPFCLWRCVSMAKAKGYRDQRIAIMSAVKQGNAIKYNKHCAKYFYLGNFANVSGLPGFIGRSSRIGR